MPRMIELIRQSAVPANMMRSAAKGALAEMIEILVYLTTQALFAEQAKMTLAGWDEAACTAVLSDPATPWEVLEYFVAPQNRRPKLLPALIENPSLREAHLIDLAQTPSREIAQIVLASARAKRSNDVLHALALNPHLAPAELDQVNGLLKQAGESTTQIQAYTELVEGEKTQYELEHAAEIAAEEGKPFELVGGTADEDAETTVSAPAAETEAATAAPAEAATAAAAAPAPATKSSSKEGSERESTLQKIAKLTVGQRVQLAMKGNKEERFVLIRDGSKVVSSAVLESPKITDSEVETFAAMKNVQESVLRGITMKRKFMKNYAVIRALVNNPRCPLDLALNLLNHLLVNDMKNLSMNKNVSDTTRKMALKLYKQKSQPAGGKKE